MHPVRNLLGVSLRWIVRDRLLHAIVGVALLLLLLVPAFSLFSMRQVQELAITLSLSAVSAVLLVIAVLLGASSIWRDIERRYSTAVLTLPLPRTAYLLGKFCAIALFLCLCAALLGGVSAVAIMFVAGGYPSDLPILWLNISAAVAMDALKYILLAAVGLLFSCISTSFFLPIFGTIAIYLAGSASQEVYEYISGEFGRTFSPLMLALLKGVYYLLPNFAAFNLKVQAIYGLPLSLSGLVFTCLYFFVYTAILLALSVWTFSRRELT